MIVDLSKPPDEEIIDDRPISVRDALVFLELAKLESPYSLPEPGMYTLLTVYYVHTTYCLLCTHYLLFIMCTLLNVYYVHTTYCLLCAHYLLFIMYILLTVYGVYLQGQILVIHLYTQYIIFNFL